MTRSSHLGADVRAYADGALDAGTLLRHDRHLVACALCCDAVRRERELLATLRCGPTPPVSAGLEAMLMRLADSSNAPTPQVVPPGLGGPRLRTVVPTSPALHHSPRRSAALATAAAGAAAAVAWGLGAAHPAAPGPAQLPAAVVASSSTAARLALFGALTAVTVRVHEAPARLRVDKSAESSP